MPSVLCEELSRFARAHRGPSSPPPGLMGKSFWREGGGGQAAEPGTTGSAPWMMSMSSQTSRSDGMAAWVFGVGPGLAFEAPSAGFMWGPLNPWGLRTPKGIIHGLISLPSANPMWFRGGHGPLRWFQSCSSMKPINQTFTFHPGHVLSLLLSQVRGAKGSLYPNSQWRLALASPTCKLVGSRRARKPAGPSRQVG